MKKITSGEEFAKKLLERIEENQRIDNEVAKIVDQIEEGLQALINDAATTSFHGGVKIAINKDCAPMIFKKVRALYGEAGWSLNLTLDETFIAMMTESLVKIADKVFKPKE